MSLSSKYILSEINKLDASNKYLLTGNFAPSNSGDEKSVKFVYFCGFRKMTLRRLAILVDGYEKSW